MTIDSDEEIMQKVKNKRPTKVEIVPQDEEQILPSTDVLFQQEVGQVRVGSNQMWNFKDAVVLGKHAQSLNDGLEEEETTNLDERAPFRVPVEERVKLWLEDKGIAIPKHLQFVEKHETLIEPKVNEAKLMHYDKEDLVSFHSLFISKALTKAASELEYDHPTVI